MAEPRLINLNCEADDGSKFYDWKSSICDCNLEGVRQDDISDYSSYWHGFESWISHRVMMLKDNRLGKFLYPTENMPSSLHIVLTVPCYTKQRVVCCSSHLICIVPANCCTKKQFSSWQSFRSELLILLEICRFCYNLLNAQFHSALTPGCRKCVFFPD